MGLFDIFRRRNAEENKKDSGQASENSETASQSAVGSESAQAANSDSERVKIATSIEPSQDHDSQSGHYSQTPSSANSQHGEPDEAMESVTGSTAASSDASLVTDESNDASAQKSGLNADLDRNEDHQQSTASVSSLTDSQPSEAKSAVASSNVTSGLTARQSVANSIAAARQLAHRTASLSADAAEKSASEQRASELASQSEQASQSVTGESVISTSVSVSENNVSESESSEASESATDTRTDAELYDQGLAKSRKTLGDRLNAFLANFRSVDEDFFDDLEETLIGADVGFNTAVQITDELRDEVKLKNAKKQQDVENVIVEKLVNLYDQDGADENIAVNMAKSGPTVIFFVGVNGVGKTTTVGKMANMYKQQGKKVLLAAADTFRAGAIEQLQVWGQRDGVPVVALPERSDPAAVVFDAVQRAKDEHFDILMVDTAGRLQNKVNLMNELSKMKRVLTREIPEAPHEVLLVLDATTGQNALNQAKTFGEITAVTGIVLTKLDGTAKGGIVLAIRNEMHLPVKFVGLGEQVNDLRPFDANEFVYGLFKGLIKE
ncbi:signal recognition particle-docking protein FtsY [Furfurilactobacillus milii]|uniref:Signal recognition particle receptor FtsY n=1 Tax=Furfurilactobacillus milii TaxID=2888272 RepID=A0A6N9I1P5_9LACO|nr:signal recognition particle-docking protein FtsY [Furfurilactobacillus milii]MYV16769.1 signal recognition particle-docking protein FtsY [Furfurilactobacillus milii]